MILVSGMRCKWNCYYKEHAIYVYNHHNHNSGKWVSSIFHFLASAFHHPPYSFQILLSIFYLKLLYTFLLPPSRFQLSPCTSCLPASSFTCLPPSTFQLLPSSTILQHQYQAQFHPAPEHRLLHMHTIVITWEWGYYHLKEKHRLSIFSVHTLNEGVSFTAAAHIHVILLKYTEMLLKEAKLAYIEEEF